MALLLLVSSMMKQAKIVSMAMLYMTMKITAIAYETMKTNINRQIGSKTFALIDTTKVIKMQKSKVVAPAMINLPKNIKIYPIPLTIPYLRGLEAIIENASEEAAQNPLPVKAIKIQAFLFKQETILYRQPTQHLKQFITHFVQALSAPDAQICLLKTYIKN